MGVSFCMRAPGEWSPSFMAFSPGCVNCGVPLGMERRQVPAGPLAFTLNRKGRPSNLLRRLSPREWQIEGHTRLGRT